MSLSFEQEVKEKAQMNAYCIYKIFYPSLSKELLK